MTRRSCVCTGILVVRLAAVAGAISLISVKDEIEIGRQAEAEVRQQVPQVPDERVVAYVRRLGAGLARHAPGPKYPYRFAVANYRELNAFALPGGAVWIHRGVLETAGNEAQVAGVVAHEIAHIAERHAAGQLTKAVVANGLLGLLGAFLGNDTGARAAQMSAALLANGLFLKFSRDDEREADTVGLQIASRAGWDPRGLIEFLQLLRQQQGRDPGSVEVFLSSHPSPAGRIERLTAHARRLPRGRRDSGQLAPVKRRLAAMPAPPRMRQRQ